MATTSTPVSPVPRRRSSRGPVPLSFAQQRLWVLDQLTQGVPLLTVPVAVRLRGRLALPALTTALGDVVRRHEILRTAIRAPEGKPLQYVSSVVSLPVPVTDLSTLPASERAAALDAELALVARTRLDPAHRVLDARVIGLAHDDHVLAMAVHHLAWDGWSTSVFYRELSQLYAARLTAVAPELPTLPIQYADFALWQRAGGGSQTYDDDLAYWIDELRDRELDLDLPTDRPRGATRSAEGDVVFHAIGREETERIVGAARRERVSLFILVSTALHAVLHRWTGQRTILTAFPHANRAAPELEDLIGVFVNALMLTTECAGDTSFRSLLRQTRAKALHALRHGELPFDRVVDALGVERDPSRNPLVRVSLAFQNATDSNELELPGLTAEPLEVHNGTAQDDLGLTVWQRDGRLHLAAEYRTDVYDGVTARRLLERLELALVAGAADPERALRDLPLVTREERGSLAALSGGSGTPVDAPPLHVMVEEQVARAPDAVALVADDESLTYRELDRRADRLAARFRALGAGRGATVAIHLDRSVDASVAVLAALKAGARFVPIDPATPAARASFLVADAEADVVVTRGPSALLTRSQQRIVDLAADDPAVDLDPPTARPRVDPGDVAYVMYTSGSTGQPKGVVVPHRGPANLIRHLARHHRLGQGDHVLHAVPLTFDTSLVELLWPLTVGATVVVAPPRVPADAAELARILTRWDVSVVFLVPSVLASYLASAPPRAPAWRLLLCNGEALDPALLRRFRAHAPDTVIVNGYGPTETSIGATTWTVPDDDVPAVVPIGRPVDGTSCHVLDADLRPVVPGARGELHVGGVGVAYGYLGRPALTAERFVPDPFGPPGTRLYRTGDVARVAADGTVQFLGRIDDQVKIGGVRVEPGEVRATLEDAPGVAAAYVTARPDSRGRSLLVAYVVAAGSASLDGAALRAFLAARLPRSMVPSRVVALPTLPLLPSGKVDVRALPEPTDSGAEPATGRVAPRTAAERTVAGVMAGVLGVDSLGATDDFFDRGGHSLQGAELVFELSKAFSVDVRLRDLFTASSVGALARLLESRRAPAVARMPAPPTSPIRLNPAGHPRLVLVHPVSGTVFCYAELARALSGRCSVQALQAPGIDDDAPAARSVDELAAQYVTALDQQSAQGPLVLGGWSMGGLVALEAARRLVAGGTPVGRVLLLDTHPGTALPDPLSARELLHAFTEDLATMSGRPSPLGDLADPRGDDVVDDRAIGDVAAMLREAGLIPESADGAFVRRRLDVYAAHLEAVRRYRPTPGAYDVDVTVLRAAASPTLAAEWSALLGRPVDERVVPGDHYAILRGEGAAALARHVVEYVGVRMGALTGSSR